MVLLQNDGTLPLSASTRVAIVGEFSATPRYQGAGSSIIYGASKAALGAITKSLARAFGKDNIRVNAIAPGFVDTGFVDWPSGAKEKAIAGSPMGRIPTVDDAANAVLYLVCDATGVTAQTIFVDCGVTALLPAV